MTPPLRAALAAALLAAALAATTPSPGQSVVAPDGTNPADAAAVGGADADDVPPEASPKVIDRGGLAPRGGTPIDTRRTFEETIGTTIYTPIRTDMYTPVQTPPG